MKELGFLHYYYGDGKGKTTAAMGLALRAAGRGIPVGIVQFLKDGSSGEIQAIQRLPGVTVLAVASLPGFTFTMTAEEKARCAGEMAENFSRAAASCREGRWGLLVLDEIGFALDAGMLNREELLDFLDRRPSGVEVVLTGHRRDPELAERADYVTEMRKEKHPYDRGIPAREGIEF